MELIVRPVNREARLLRELAKQVQAISAADKYDLRRDLSGQFGELRRWIAEGYLTAIEDFDADYRTARL